MSKSPPAKIPSEDIEDCQPWPIPQWDEQDNVLPSAEIEDREREAENADETGEIIEIEAENLQPLTAEMLEEITRNAQAEGRTRPGYGRVGSRRRYCPRSASCTRSALAIPLCTSRGPSTKSRPHAV